MQVVILAGGKGSRLAAQVPHIPKAMVDINGKPLLLIIIEELRKYAVKEFVLCLGYLADQIKDYFKDGSSLGIHITYSMEPSFLGTAGALKYAQHYLDDHFMVLNGDTFLPIDYDKVWQEFLKRETLASMVVYDNGQQIAMNNVAIDSNEMVISYMKHEQVVHSNMKDDNIQYQFLDAGVYMFNKKVLSLIPSDKPVSLECEVFPILIRQNQLAASLTSQRFYDVGTPQRLLLFREVYQR
jgi:NDP-sugar pyrophosphorylase family protein